MGLRRTPPAETLLACARDLSLLDLLVLVDCALQHGDATLDDLAAATTRRRRGAPLLRRALAYADGRSESPWETLLRVLHVVCGIDVEWTRRGYTREDVLHQSIGILRDADRSTGRAHDPGRIRAWNALLRESCFTPAGMARLSRRLGLTVDDAEPASGHSTTA